MAGLHLKLEDLPHQDDAIEAILNNFDGIDKYTNDPDADYQFANPILERRGEEARNIDIKMETGTGKTFVYTRMIYELHQKYGLFKFIIVVPSPAIKEGTRSFIESDYARQYFRSHYHTEINLATINAGDFSNNKTGRLNPPAKLQDYLEGTRADRNTIQVLLINAGMLSSRANMMNPNRHYDQMLTGGFDNPRDAIALTRPIVIIDEPHRFDRNKTDYNQILKLEPQRIIRFGATFPIKKYVKDGKSIKTPKNLSGVNVIHDYYRGAPQYNLNAVESFNQNLVKGIDVIYPVLDQVNDDQTYVISRLTDRAMELEIDGREYIVKIGDELSTVDGGFGGNLCYNGRVDGEYQLSNGKVLTVGMRLTPGIYSQSYQEEMIEIAISNHLEKEKNNFLRQNSARVKTLSLFFIDDIKSYRRNGGWLRQKFEEILKRQLESALESLRLATKPREIEYRDFLRASLDNISETHGGYFSKDNSSSDEAIQNEVNDILRGKERLLQFKDENGQWILRRFLFSKWTLREGWDNPNVFVIAKLRSSGSENSKIQEVGRGLRLPVDETGHRLTASELEARLDYIIGSDEQSFARQLVNEVNSDVEYSINRERLTDEMINAIVKYQREYNLNYTADVLRNELGDKGIIDYSCNFKNNVSINGRTMTGFDWLKELHPEVDNTLRKGRVRDSRHDPPANKVKLVKENWNQLKTIWHAISRRYMLEFSPVDDIVEEIVSSVLEDKELYTRSMHKISQASLGVRDDEIVADSAFKIKSLSQGSIPPIPYGKFLKELVENTNISVDVAHRHLCEVIKEFDGDTSRLSKDTLAKLIKEINHRLHQSLSQRYCYRQLDYRAQTSVYDPETDEFVDNINANDIGIYDSSYRIDNGRYLYEMPVRYDSGDPELKIIEGSSDIPEIVVFGKLPKQAIRIPRYNGSTSTPDLVFMVENSNGRCLYLLVEAKADKGQQRESDVEITRDQKNFFDSIKHREIQYIEANSLEDVTSKLKKMLEEPNND